MKFSGYNLEVQQALSFADASVLLMNALSRNIFKNINPYVSKLPTDYVYENTPLVEHTYSSIAQSVEHSAVNRSVVGSSPTWGVARNGELLCKAKERRVESFEERYGWLRSAKTLGSLVKRSRHRPFTAVTRVRFP